MADSSQLEVLRLLANKPDRTQREMARELGISLGKANYVVRTLLKRGWVKARTFSSSRDKRRYVYLLTPKGVAAKAELARLFLSHRAREYEALMLEIERLRSESKGIGTA